MNANKLMMILVWILSVFSVQAQIATKNSKLATIAECNAAGGNISGNSAVLPTKAIIKSNVQQYYSVTISNDAVYNDQQCVQTKDVSYTYLNPKFSVTITLQADNLRCSDNNIIACFSVNGETKCIENRSSVTFNNVPLDYEMDAQYFSDVQISLTPCDGGNNGYNFEYYTERVEGIYKNTNTTLIVNIY